MTIYQSWHTGLEIDEAVDKALDDDVLSTITIDELQTLVTINNYVEMSTSKRVYAVTDKDVVVGHCILQCSPSLDSIIQIFKTSYKHKDGVFVVDGRIRTYYRKFGILPPYTLGELTPWETEIGIDRIVVMTEAELEAALEQGTLEDGVLYLGTEEEE